MAQFLIAQRNWTFVMLFVLMQGSLAAYLSKRSTTITIPDGVTYHPESQDICTQTSWTDVVSFFVGNYLSHVATIIKAPGEPIYITGLNMVFVLLFPCFGAGRGLVTIYQRASFYKDPLQQALRAQALVMVVRVSGEWQPQAGDSLRSLCLWPPKKAQSNKARLDPEEYYQAALSKHWTKVNAEKFKGYIGRFKMIIAPPPWLTMNYGLSKLHMIAERGYRVSGTCNLPQGYRLAYVPPNAQVEHVMPEVALSRILQTSYSLASGVISIVQIFSACSALYQSKGHQIDAYGYAAFGFTVTPYLVMSFVNLLANCFTPTFPNLYLVHTEMMDEAISRGGEFTDIVGKLESEPLLAEDLTLFTASIEPPQQEGGQVLCRIANQMFEHGSTEPIPTKHEGQDGQHSAGEDNMGLLAIPQEGTSSPLDEEVAQKQASVTIEHDHTPGEPQTDEDDDDPIPTLIIPGCYKFKTAYSNTSSTSILHRRKHYGPRGVMVSGITWGVAALPFIPLGVMSKFRTGTSSTIAQRVWLMTWYIVGMVSVSNPYFTDHFVDVVYHRSRRLIKNHGISGKHILFLQAPWMVIVLMVLATPAIGGFVVVGQMLIAYGSCTGL
ncbi:hypothetical protein TMatcc_000206 [Talaromyces marneffei ATCC 18224]|uniref:Uncharacterized protein n=1 Tax=Talaromyces marneffei (strain ATCC 18224 / CBS 334.59 / QM 7333) TaxID=441960 RepID=B6QQ79_TALMQ|nr:hypothetical protein PMAA_040770 [Talaromyces marneffei ATCC 18224]